MENALKDIFSSLLSQVHDDEIAMYKSVHKNKAVENAIKTLQSGDYEQLEYSIKRPIDGYLAGLIRSEIADCDRVVFIISNYRFVENHFETLINKIEGMACCADKSRSIMRALIKFLVTGENIEFDYSQEYTYHLPRGVFKDHDSIVSFFRSLEFLYYGKSEQYIRQLAKLMTEVV